MFRAAKAKNIKLQESAVSSSLFFRICVKICVNHVHPGHAYDIHYLN